MSNRKLDLEKFLDAIPPELLKQYFDQKSKDFGKTVYAGAMTTRAIIAFLDSKDDDDIRDVIRQDIIQINDLCERNIGLLVEEVNKRQIFMHERESREELSMRVFLQYRDVFNYAHDRYYFTHSSGKISEHNISSKTLDITDDKRNLFGSKVREFFSKSAKGGNCIIRYHQKNGGLMIAIVRGSYKKAVSTWDDDVMKCTKTLVYRPAEEDILEFNLLEQKLCIKTRTQKDREMYISIFVEDIICDKSQAVRRDRDDTFDLSVLQDAEFRFDINEDVQSVYLLEVRVSMAGVREPDWILRSKDVLSSLKEDVRGLRINNGVIQQAKFLFRLNIDRKVKKVSFEITPPNATNLNKKKYARIINQYLERIGIKKNAEVFASRVVEDSGALV